MVKKPTYEEQERRLQEFENAERIRIKSNFSFERKTDFNSISSTIIEDIVFEDLFSLDDIQSLQDEFADATGVASIITNIEGTPITKPSNFCKLCIDVIRTTEKGRINCFKSDARIGRYNSEGPIVQTCMSGGLWDAGAGIKVGGKHIANWLIGQVRDEELSKTTTFDHQGHEIDHLIFPVGTVLSAPGQLAYSQRCIAKQVPTITRHIAIPFSRAKGGLQG